MVGLLLIALLGQRPFAPRPPFRNANEVLRVLPGAPARSLECAGTVAGAYGQAVTFTRGSSGTCTKSDGTVSTLLTNVPRVQSAGLLMEPARTNLIIRSQEIDNAAWTKANAGAGVVPTVTANHATVAPDGTATAEQVQFSSTPSATDASFVQATGITGTAAAYSAGCYMRATTGTATTHLSLVAGASMYTVQASLTTTWQRVTLENKTLTATTWYLMVGTNRPSPTNHATTAAADILLWGCGVEAGARASSYIATTTASVTRAADSATVTNPLATADTRWCIAVTIDGNTWPSVTGNGVFALGSFTAANSAYLTIEDASGKPTFGVFDNGGGQKFIKAAGALAAGRRRLRACSNAGALTLSADGVDLGAAAGAGTGVIGTMPATLRLGALGAASTVLAAGLSDVCITKDLMGCNP